MGGRRESNSGRILLLLAVATAAAFILRLLYITHNPPALNQDEAMNAYNAFSIGRTLRDSRGFLLPVLVHGFGNIDFRVPLYCYLSVPFIWLMGLGETSARMAALVVNVALIPLVFVLADKMFRNKVVALMSAALLAMNPWSFHYSRVAHEATLAPFFYFSSFLLLYLALKEKPNIKYFASAGLIFGLSIYSYPIAQLMSPLIFALLCSVFYRETASKWKYVLCTAIIAVVISFPFFYAAKIAQGEMESRFEQVSVLHSPNIIQNIAGNYAKYFSPDFLFLKGDVEDLPGTGGRYGMFHLYILPLLLLGLCRLIYILYREPAYRREAVLAAGMLLIYPLPASLTFPSPHALRGYTLIPVFHIISALGIWLLVEAFIRFKFPKSARIALYSAGIALVSFVFIRFLFNYYFVYPVYTEDYYQFGIKEACGYVKEHQDRYSRVYFTSHANQPFIYMLFYTRYNPSKYQKAKKSVDQRGFGRVDSFDKYHFVPDEKMPTGEKGCLFVTRNEMSGLKQLKVIRNSSGRTVFRIWASR